MEGQDFNFYYHVKQVLQNNRPIEQHLVKKYVPLSSSEQQYNNFMLHTVDMYQRQHQVFKELENNLHENLSTDHFEFNNMIEHLRKNAKSDKFINNLKYFLEATTSTEKVRAENQKIKKNLSTMDRKANELQYIRYPQNVQIWRSNSIDEKIVHALEAQKVYESFILIAAADQKNLQSNAFEYFWNTHKDYFNDQMCNKFSTILANKDQLQKLQSKFKQFNDKYSKQIKNGQCSHIEMANLDSLFLQGLEAKGQYLMIADILKEITVALIEDTKNLIVDYKTTNYQNQKIIRDLVEAIEASRKRQDVSMINFINKCYDKCHQSNERYKKDLTMELKMRQIQSRLQIHFAEKIKDNNCSLQACMNSLHIIQEQLTFAHQALDDILKLPAEQKKAKLSERIYSLYSAYDQEKMKLQRQIQDLKRRLSVQKEQKSSQCEALYSNTVDQMKQLRQQIISKNQQAQQIRQQKKKLQQQYDNEMAILKNKLQQLEQQKKNFQQQLKSRINQINKESNETIQSLQCQTASLKQQLNKAKSIMPDFQQLKTQKQNLQNTQISLNDTIQNLQLQLQSEKQRASKLLSYKQESQRYQQLFKQEEAKRQQLSNKLKLQSEELCNLQRKLIEKDQLFVSKCEAMFNDQIFFNKEYQKQILINHLQKYMKSPLERTSLIYKYDTRNKANFHQYIDQVSNLCLVVKTPLAIIAGFYPGVHKQKEVMNKGGLLVSVTNNESYTLHKKKPNDKMIYRGMTYDQYYIIYGNAEIRIKTGQNTVFSNFGVNNGFYNTRGHKVEKFLNEQDKREVEFKTYEIYQLFFKYQGCNEI